MRKRYAIAVLVSGILVCATVGLLLARTGAAQSGSIDTAATLRQPSQPPVFLHPA